MQLETGFQILHVHAQDPYVGGLDQIFNRLPLDMKSAWADILFKWSTQKEILGSGRTVMMVARKTRAGDSSARHL